MTAGFLFTAFMVTHKGLHNGMVCGVHVGVQREGTLPLAIVRCISLWSDDPVLRVGRETERNLGLESWYSVMEIQGESVRVCASVSAHWRGIRPTCGCVCVDVDWICVNFGDMLAPVSST